MTPTMATVLQVLVVALTIGPGYFSIWRYGNGNALIYSVFLVAPPLLSWLVWASRGREAPLPTLLVIGTCTGFVSAAVWRLRMDRDTKEYRYQVLALAVMAPATLVIVGLAVAYSPTIVVAVALLGAFVAFSLASLSWRLFRERLQQQGWEW